jgi:hypothetical protein
MEMDIIIDNLKLVLDSMQKSYKKIKENDIDGLIVDKVEYKYMNFEDLDEEIDSLMHMKDKKEKKINLNYIKNNDDEIKIKIKDDNKVKVEFNNEIINNNNSIILNESSNKASASEVIYDDDIDGEPI